MPKLGLESLRNISLNKLSNILLNVESYGWSGEDEGKLRLGRHHIGSPLQQTGQGAVWLRPD